MLVDRGGVTLGLPPEGVQLTERPVANGDELVLVALTMLLGLAVGLLQQPIGVPLGLGGDVARLLLGHPEDLLGAAAQVVEVGMGPFLGAAEVVSQLAVLGDQALDLSLQLVEPGLRGADEAVDGLAVVPAAVGREVIGRKRCA